jgi:hypothetical protein
MAEISPEDCLDYFGAVIDTHLLLSADFESLLA